MALTNNSKLAQFFTPESVAKNMVSLCSNSGRVLEPSCGNGILVETYAQYGQHNGNWADITSIELDAEIAPEYAQTIDFFDYSIDETFDTIIANPPYLRFRDIPESTKQLPYFIRQKHLLSEYANLYAYFIAKCYSHLNRHGEMVFVVPSDCFRVTGNSRLMELLHNNGTFTDVVHYKKSPFLPDVSQEVVVWRYECDNMSHVTNVEVL